MQSRNSIEETSASYRKGVVLGLTMAEIVLLLTFLILLALASLLLEKEKALEAANQLIEKVIPNGNPREFRELVRDYQQTITQLDKAETELTEKTDELEEAKKELESSEWLRELQDDLKISDKNEFRELAKDAAELRQEVGDEPTFKQIQLENKRLAENNQQLSQKVQKLGGSGEPLQCWYNPETKKSEYIFDVALRDDGFVIRDNALPHRAEEQSHLPIGKQLFNQPLSPSQFQSQLRPLYRWSLSNECRFTVRAFDEVKGSKSVYKKRLQELEGYFYKLNVDNERF
tara:strand:+ start:8658 stop:9521 length:864 start_codon:yes stop_codon:yes gene_type:complete